MTHVMTLACTFLFDQQSATGSDHMPGWVMSACGIILCLFLGLLGATSLWVSWNNKFKLDSLLTEANGDASLSRFQLLIFTFVIAFSLFYLVERNETKFPDIPDGVLTLLGISASTYAVGKGISFSREEGVLTDDQIADKNAAQVQTAQAQAQTAQAQAQAVQAQAQAQAARAHAAQAIVQAAEGGPGGPAA
jgi:hypothetical protein